MRERLAKLGIPVLIFATLLVGCPLPFEFSGEGAGETERDPASPDVTAPVTIAYSESGGGSGTLANDATFVSGVDTTITLSTETPNAVIYYTTNGGLTDLNAATRINASSGSFVILRTTNLEQRTISAIAVGPNMRPSPEVTASVDISPFPIITVSRSAASISEDPTVIPGSTANFIVTSSQAPTSDLTINLEMSGDYATGDVQILDDVGNPVGAPGTTAAAFPVTLLAGTTSVAVPIAALQEDIDTVNQSATLTVIGEMPDATYSVGSPASATITIADTNTPTLTMTNDAPGTPAEIADNAGSVTYTIAPAGGTLNAPVTITLQTSGTYDSTDILESPATIPESGNTFTVTLPAGQPNVTVVVTPQPDLGEYVNETFGLRLMSQPHYTVAAGSGTEQQFQIVDSSVHPILTMTEVDFTGPDNSVVPVTVSSHVNPEVTLTIPLQFVAVDSSASVNATFEVGDFSIGGDATIGIGGDYNSLTIDPGPGPWTASVNLIGLPETTDSDTEAIVIAIPANAAWTLGGDTEQVIQLVDSDAGVTYDANTSDVNLTGTVPVDGTIYTSGTTVTVAGNPNALARPGFTFGGWKTNPFATSADYSAGGRATFVITADTTLYAHWIANSYTIGYNNNSPLGNTSAGAPVFGGTNHTISGALGTRDGHTFAGWNTAPDGSGDSYATGSTYYVVADLSLFAQWTPDAPTAAVNALDQVTFGGGLTRINPQPTLLSTSTIAAAEAITFRLSIVGPPSTGASPDIGNGEVDIDSVAGAASLAQVVTGAAQAFGSTLTVYARVRSFDAFGNRTAWSGVTSNAYTVDDYLWDNRITPSSMIELDAALGDASVDLIDLRPVGGATFYLGDVGYNTLTLNSATPKTIVGDGAIIDGGATGVRVFELLPNADLTLNGLTVQNGWAQGHFGSTGGGGGGGAPGMGGGVFAGNGAVLSLTNVAFLNNQAVGGNGGNGGNGMSPGGNGAGPNGGPGGGPGAGGAPGFGDFSGGGGGGTDVGNLPLFIGNGGDGGDGGYGAGGGGGGGRGTGAGSAAGIPGVGGTYGGLGGPGAPEHGGGGGGGAALGGAIFMDTGSTLNIFIGVSFTNNTAVGGLGGGAPNGGQQGEGRGGALFIRSGATFNQVVAPTYSGNSASWAQANILEE